MKNKKYILYITLPFLSADFLLCVPSPASIGPAYFREISEVINAGGPPNMQQILAIMQRHGLELAKGNG